MIKPLAVASIGLMATLCRPLCAGAEGAAAYTADPQQSRLEFTGIQAGAEFKGVFHKFSAAVDFAAQDPAASRIDVQIDIRSADTMDKDRDQTLRGPDILDAAHFPSAHYVTRSIVKTATGFSAIGQLTLRGVTKDVPIDFQFAPGPTAAKLAGAARLRRLDFGAGQGEWKATEWIDDVVKVSFSLILKPKT